MEESERGGGREGKYTVCVCVHGVYNILYKINTIYCIMYCVKISWMWWDFANRVGTEDSRSYYPDSAIFLIYINDRI